MQKGIESIKTLNLVSTIFLVFLLQQFWVDRTWDIDNKDGETFIQNVKQVAKIRVVKHLLASSKMI